MLFCYDNDQEYNASVLRGLGDGSLNVGLPASNEDSRIRDGR